MKTIFSLHPKDFPRKLVGVIFLANILLLSSGCQSTRVKITPSSPSLSSTSTLPATIATIPLPTNIPIPSETHPPIASPTLVIFPLPKAISINAFSQPMVENMKTNQLINGGTWTTYTPPAWPKIFQQTGAYPTVSCIVESLDGTLWFGTRGSEEPGAGAQGVFRFDGKTWTHFRVENGLPFDEITSMAVSPDGVIWFGGYGVARYDGKSWTTYTTDNGLASDDIRSIAYAPDGTLWIGSSDKGLMRFDGKGWQYFLQQYNDNYIGHIFILPDNSLLFSYSYGFSAELIRFDGRNWTNDPTPWTEHGKYAVDIASAPNGDLWFATEFMGVYRLSQNTWTNYTDKDGLPSDEMITSVAVARDGSVWVGSMNGLSRFDGKTWNTITLQDDTGSQWIGSIFAATDGSVWISYYGGIARFNPATIQ